MATRYSTEQVIENRIPEFAIVINVCRYAAGIARKNESIQRNIENVENSVLEANMAANNKLNNFPFLIPDDTKVIPMMFDMTHVTAMTNVATPLMM